MRLVEVGDVPGAGLDPDAVDDAARGLKADAGAVRDGGNDVAGAWAGLGASYEAPEAAQLLRVLDPVRADTDRLAGELERVASALATFAGELREIVTKGDRLRVEVAEFRARVAAAPVGGTAEMGFGAGPGFGGDSALGLDPVLATQNAFLTSRIAALAEELVEAERACAAAVRAVDGWQERAAGLLLNTARGVATDRMPWGEPGGPESCAGQAIEQVMGGIWNSGSWVPFLSAYPILSKLGGPGVSPVDQHAVWAEAGRSLIGWGVSEGEGFVEGLVQDIAVAFDDVAILAEEITTDVVDWSSDQIDALWQTGKDAIEWTGARAQDVSDWVAEAADVAGSGIADAAVGVWDFSVDNWGAVADDWANFGEMTGVNWDATAGSVLEGRWPRTTEVVASGSAASGALLGAVLTTASGGIVEFNIFDDGDASVGELTRVSPNGYGDAQLAPIIPPVDLESLARSVSGAYELEESTGNSSIRITTVESRLGDQFAATGPRVIVSIPGTEEWAPVAGSNPADLEGNLVTAGGGRSTLTDAVLAALEKANLPEDAQVMLVGHSQGGMTAADIASDPALVERYHVKNVMTFGSPIDSAHIDPTVGVMEVQHLWDVVPMLDMGDSRYLPGINGLPALPGLPSGYEQAGASHATVTLPAPGSLGQIKLNHDHTMYGDSLAAHSESKVLKEYEEKLLRDGFLVQDGSTVSALDAHVIRTD